MDPLKRFGEYAAAFEKAYDSNDWSVLEPFFEADAVYEIVGGKPFAGRHEGRDAVFAHFESSVNGFDRRFDTRNLEVLEGPKVRDDGVWMRWKGIYSIAGAPDLAIEGEELVSFEGDRIRRLEDRYPEGAGEPLMQFMSAHGAKLHPAGGPG